MSSFYIYTYLSYKHKQIFTYTEVAHIWKLWIYRDCTYIIVEVTHKLYLCATSVYVHLLYMPNFHICPYPKATYIQNLCTTSTSVYVQFLYMRIPSIYMQLPYIHIYESFTHTKDMWICRRYVHLCRASDFILHSKWRWLV